MDKIYTVHFDASARKISIWFNGVMVADNLDRAEATLMMEIFMRNIFEEE